VRRKQGARWEGARGWQGHGERGRVGRRHKQHISKREFLTGVGGPQGVTWGTKRVPSKKKKKLRVPREGGRDGARALALALSYSHIFFLVLCRLTPAVSLSLLSCAPCPPPPPSLPPSVRPSLQEREKGRKRAREKARAHARARTRVWGSGLRV
jgi:hypothetical protein